MFDLTRLSQWGLAFILLVLTLGVVPAELQAQTTPVYIDDSPAAVDQLTEAVRLRSQNRLTEAVTKYQHVLETYRHKLMQTDKPYFTDTRRLVVNRLLSDEPMLTTYRKQYEASAKRMLLQAATSQDRLTALLNVVDRYFLCTSGMQAGLDAAGILLARADIPAAAALLEQFNDHPDRQDMAKRYDALRWSAKVLLDPMGLADEQPRDGELSPAYVIPPNVAPFSGLKYSGWSLPTLPDDVTQLWSIQIDNPYTQARSQSSRRRFINRQRQQNLPNAAQGNLIPLIQGDRLFVNSQQGISVYDRLSGRPLWQYQMDTDGPTNSNMLSSSTLDHQRSVCVTENRVLGIVGFMSQWRASWQLKKHQTHLVCLDMQNGNPLWETQPVQLDEGLDEVFFHGTPLADDRRVYVLMRRSQNSGFHTVYLAALDITDGHLLWKRHLASAAMGNHNRTYALGEMTLYQGQVYVTDNLGTVSAIDGLTGDMLWLVMLDRSFDSQDVEEKSLVAQHRRRTTAASRPAPIVTSNKVLVSPAWVNEPAQVIDRHTGIPLRKLDEAGFETGCQLALTDAGLLSIDSTVRLFDVKDFAKKWECKLRGIPGNEKPQFLIHDKTVMVQSKDKLTTINLADGKIIAEYPFNQDGVIITAEQQWIISRDDELVSLMRWDDAYDQLVSRIERYPDQAWPGLALSHLAVGRSQWDTAIRGIDWAIESINLTPGIPANSTQQQQVQQVFDHIRDQIELPAEGVKDPQLAAQAMAALPDHLTVLSLFERLAMMSMTPINEVTQQFARGRYYQFRGQGGLAIENYQSVLADPTLASQLYQFDEGARQARLEARLRLIEIVGSDPQTMAKFQTVAAEHYRQLEQMPTTSAQSYLAMAESYPLTQAAAKARIAAARQFWRTGDLAKAVGLLQTAYHQSNDPQTKQQIVGQLAEGFQKLGSPAQAHRVLKDFALLFPQTPVERDGQMVSVEAWISELAHSHPLQSRYPTFNLALGQAAGLNGRLLLPTQHAPDVHSQSLVLLQNDALCLYRLDERKIIWSIQADDQQVQLLAQSPDQLLLWQPTLSQLQGIDIRTGQQLWEPIALTDEVQSVAAQPNRLAMEPNVQREWMQMMNPNGLAVVQGRIREARHEVDLSLRMTVAKNILVAADGTGRVLAIDRATGIVLWKRLYALDILEHLAITDSVLGIGGRVGLPNDTQSHRKIVVDLNTGEPLMHPLEEKEESLLWLGIINPDLLISITRELVTAHRIGTGEVVWRLPNPGTPILNGGNSTQMLNHQRIQQEQMQTGNIRLNAVNALGQAHVMLFRDEHGMFTSIDLNTGQITGTWLTGNSDSSPAPQLKQADDRYFLLTPTQLTCTDLSGNLLWHDAINTTTQYLLAMQLSEKYMVLLTRRDMGWGNGEMPNGPDAMIDQPIHAPMQGGVQERRINRMPEGGFDDAPGQYRYQILLLDRASGRILHEQALSAMVEPIHPSDTILTDNHLILTTNTQTIVIPAGE